MQVPAPEWSTLQPPPLPPGTLTARVAGGDLAALPVGELLRAVVVRVEAGSATLLVQGRELIIQPSHPMKPGTVWLVRRPSPDPHPQLNISPPLLTWRPQRLLVQRHGHLPRQAVALCRVLFPCLPDETWVLAPPVERR